MKHKKLFAILSRLEWNSSAVERSQLAYGRVGTTCFMGMDGRWERCVSSYLVRKPWLTRHLYPMRRLSRRKHQERQR